MSMGFYIGLFLINIRKVIRTIMCAICYDLIIYLPEKGKDVDDDDDDDDYYYTHSQQTTYSFIPFPPSSSSYATS